jgi:hypothetical protein
MTTLWFGSISSLLGVLIGAGATYLIQSLNWKRETRRQVYANFIGESRIWLDSIERVRFAIEHKFPDCRPHWDRANAGRAQVFGLRAQAEMLGTEPTREAALNLEQSMESMNKGIAGYNDLAHPPDAEAYKEEFNRCLNKFRDAAIAELHVGPWSFFRRRSSE